MPHKQILFTTESVDGPRGQFNRKLRAHVDGVVVGHIDYSEYEDVTQVTFIDVSENFRRNGYGTALVLKLQSDYPGIEIKWGLLTEDGAKFYESIPKFFIENEEYKAKSEELKSVMSKLSKYSALSDAFFRIQTPTDEQREKFQALTSNWNDLHDLKDELNSYIFRNSSGTTILLAPSALNTSLETHATRTKMRP